MDQIKDEYEEFFTNWSPEELRTTFEQYGVLFWKALPRLLDAQSSMDPSFEASMWRIQHLKKNAPIADRDRIFAHTRELACLPPAQLINAVGDSLLIDHSPHPGHGDTFFRVGSAWDTDNSETGQIHYFRCLEHGLHARPPLAEN